MEQLIGFIQTVYAFIATNLGLKADAASRTGTLHAKVTEHRNKFMTQLVTSNNSKWTNAGGAVNSVQIVQITRFVPPASGSVRFKGDIYHYTTGTTEVYVVQGNQFKGVSFGNIDFASLTDWTNVNFTAAEVKACGHRVIYNTSSNGSTSTYTGSFSVTKGEPVYLYCVKSDSNVAGLVSVSISYDEVVS